MAGIPEVVHVRDTTELAEILDAVDNGPVSLEYKGKRYRLIYEQPPSTEIDAIVQKSIARSSRQLE